MLKQTLFATAAIGATLFAVAAVLPMTGPWRTSATASTPASAAGAGQRTDGSLAAAYNQPDRATRGEPRDDKRDESGHDKRLDRKDQKHHDASDD